MSIQVMAAGQSPETAKIFELKTEVGGPSNSRYVFAVAY